LRIATVAFNIDKYYFLLDSYVCNGQFRESLHIATPKTGHLALDMIWRSGPVMENSWVPKCFRDIGSLIQTKVKHTSRTSAAII
jgi:hypothetical protein